MKTKTTGGAATDGTADESAGEGGGGVSLSLERKTAVILIMKEAFKSYHLAWARSSIEPAFKAREWRAPGGLEMVWGARAYMGGKVDVCSPVVWLLLCSSSRQRDGFQLPLQRAVEDSGGDKVMIVMVSSCWRDFSRSLEPVLTWYPACDGYVAALTLRGGLSGGGGPKKAFSGGRAAGHARRLHGHDHQEAEKPRGVDGPTFQIGENLNRSKEGGGLGGFGPGRKVDAAAKTVNSVNTLTDETALLLVST